jgi:pimeloyl-ACP methyl ester carboxylesterase
MMHALSRDGATIAYDVVGQGAPVVLLHGFTESNAIWRELGYVERLQRGGRRLVLIDCRGHGGSSKPHEPRAYSALNCADDVIAILDRLRIARTDVLGHSMGGAIGFALAALHPARVRGLVVIGAHPLAQDMSSYRNALDGGIARWIELLETEAGPLSVAARRRQFANDVLALRACVANDRPDRSAHLSKSTASILAIAGVLDPARPKIQRFAFNHGAEYLELDNRGHVTSLLAVNEVLARVETFLEQLDACDARLNATAP